LKPNNLARFNLFVIILRSMSFRVSIVLPDESVRTTRLADFGLSSSPSRSGFHRHSSVRTAFAPMLLALCTIAHIYDILDYLPLDWITTQPDSRCLLSSPLFNIVIWSAKGFPGSQNQETEP